MFHWEDQKLLCKSIFGFLGSVAFGTNSRLLIFSFKNSENWGIGGVNRVIPLMISFPLNHVMHSNQRTESIGAELLLGIGRPGRISLPLFGHFYHITMQKTNLPVINPPSPRQWSSSHRDEIPRRRITPMERSNALAGLGRSTLVFPLAKLTAR